MFPKTIIHGIRDQRFTMFIQNVLQLAKLSPKIIDRIILDQTNLKLFSQAFTHPSVSDECNYEYLEFMGDSTLNKSIVWYLTRRFPNLCCGEGVKVLARLKINLVSRRTFAEFGKSLNFTSYISAEEFFIKDKPEKLVEDTFEAFFGATELIIDKTCGQNTGYNACYHIIANLLDTIDISLKYEDLYDAKTRLKEIFDIYTSKLGLLRYITIREDNIFKSKLVRTINGKQIVMATSENRIKMESEQECARIAIERLGKEGYSRPISDFYKKLIDSS